MNMRDVKGRKQKRRRGGSSGGADYPLFCLGGTRRNELHSLVIVGWGMY